MNAKQANVIRHGIKIGRWIGDDFDLFLKYLDYLRPSKLEARAMARSVDPFIRALAMRLYP